MCAVIVIGLLALLGLSAFPVTQVSEAGSVIAPSQPACPVTLPNGMTPPAEDPALGHHGDGRLHMVLGPDGAASLTFVTKVSIVDAPAAAAP